MRNKLFPATLKFVQNDKGEVVKLILIQGRETHAPKIK